MAHWRGDLCPILFARRAPSRSRRAFRIAGTHGNDASARWTGAGAVDATNLALLEQDSQPDARPLSLLSFDGTSGRRPLGTAFAHRALAQFTRRHLVLAHGPAARACRHDRRGRCGDGDASASLLDQPDSRRRHHFCRTDGSARVTPLSRLRCRPAADQPWEPFCNAKDVRDAAQAKRGAISAPIIPRPRCPKASALARRRDGGRKTWWRARTNRFDWRCSPCVQGVGSRVPACEAAVQSLVNVVSWRGLATSTASSSPCRYPVAASPLARRHPMLSNQLRGGDVSGGSDGHPADENGSGSLRGASRTPIRFRWMSVFPRT